MRKVPLSVRVRPEVKSRLDELAASQKRSLSNVTEEVLARALHVNLERGLVLENAAGYIMAVAQPEDVASIEDTLEEERDLRQTRRARRTTRTYDSPGLPGDPPSEPPAKKKKRARTLMCEHRIRPGSFCKVCDE